MQSNRFHKPCMPVIGIHVLHTYAKVDTSTKVKIINLSLPAISCNYDNSNQHINQISDAIDMSLSFLRDDIPIGLNAITIISAITVLMILYLLNLFFQVNHLTNS